MNASHSGALALPLLGAGILLALMAPGLMDYSIRRTLRRIDRFTRGQGSLSRELHEQVQATPGRLARFLVAQALMRRHRLPLGERLALRITSVAATIAGADQRGEEWRGDHDELKAEGAAPSSLLVNAIGMLMSASQIAWNERVGRQLRDAYPRAYAWGSRYLDAAARSKASAHVMVSLPYASAAALAGYEIGSRLGGHALGEAIAFAVIFAIAPTVHAWQPARLLAVRLRRALNDMDDMQG